MRRKAIDYRAVSIQTEPEKAALACPRPDRSDVFWRRQRECVGARYGVFLRHPNPVARLVLPVKPRVAIAGQLEHPFVSAVM